MKTLALTPAVICLLLLCGITLRAQSNPAIFYTDLDSGPNTGGENNNGAWITIYGKGFGDTQGVVLIGNQPAAAYHQWRDGKISFQPGGAAPAGATTIVVQRADTAISNGVPFTIRSGNIFFVSSAGSDSNNGSFGAPWRTIVRAKNSIAAGDIAYVMAGVSQTGVDAYNASLAIRSAGAAGRPKALVAYPGASPTIGSAIGTFGIRTPELGAHYNYWTLAGFSVQGRQAIKLVAVSGWRLIANDLSCPNGNGPGACLLVALSNNVRVLGNSIHNSGSVGASNQYHSLDFTSDSNHIEAGWNVIANNHSCRGIQFLSSPLGSNSGFNQYDLSVHDNLIHGQVCDGINFATIDPSRGPVLAYNNIIYSVGLGPDPPDGPSSYSCIYSPGLTNTGNPGSGTAQIFNNTMYDCGPWGATAGNSSAGAISVVGGSPQVQFVNNIIMTLPGEASFGSTTDPNLTSGTNNLFGSVDINGVPGPGSGPAQFTNSINADPAFVDAGTGNFHLLDGSAAIDGGAVPPVSLTHDFDGNPRPLGAAFDVGAYEAVPPTPDFSISATPALQTITVGGSTSYAASVNPLNGFSSTVNLSASVGGSPAGVSTSFDLGSISGGSGSSTLSVATTSATPAGTYAITITGTSDSLSHSTSVTLVVNPPPPPDFSISATPASQTITVGGSTSYTASVSPLNYFNSTVNLSAAVSGSPVGVTTSLNPPSVGNGSGSSTLNVTTSSATPPGTYTITISCAAAGGFSHAMSLTLVVNVPTNHRVDLSWAPSSSTDVVAYNVYRSIVSGEQYIQIGRVTGTAFTDNNVSQGMTYFYVVTAVTSSGEESGYSAEVSGNVL